MAGHMPQLQAGRGLRLDDAASATSMAAFDGAAHTARAVHTPCVCSACAVRVPCMCSACAVRVRCVCAACALRVRCVCACVCTSTVPARTPVLVLALSRRGHRPDDGVRLGDRLLHPGKQRPTADARAREYSMLTRSLGNATLSRERHATPPPLPSGADMVRSRWRPALWRGGCAVRSPMRGQGTGTTRTMLRLPGSRHQVPQ